MLKLYGKGFVVKIEDVVGFKGEITHKGDSSMRLFISQYEDETCSELGVPFMAFRHLNEENAASMYDDFLKQIPESMRQGFDSIKSIFIETALKYPVILVDKESISKLANNDLDSMCILFHELGHFVHSDEKYYETQEHRNDALFDNRVIKSELDADEFAFSVYGDDYYNAMIRQHNSCVEKFRVAEFEPRYIPIIKELEARLNVLADNHGLIPPDELRR